MRYDSIRKGQEVLYSRHRTFSQAHSLAQCVTAEVMATGLHHEYRTVGSYSEAGKHKTSEQGVRIRLTSGPDEGTELVTLASYLVEADASTLARWVQARAAVDKRNRERAEIRDRQRAMKARFASLGFEVSITHGGSLTFASADVERLINQLEDAYGTGPAEV